VLVRKRWAGFWTRSKIRCHGKEKILGEASIEMGSGKTGRVSKEGKCSRRGGHKEAESMVVWEEELTWWVEGNSVGGKKQGGLRQGPRELKHLIYVPRHRHFSEYYFAKNNEQPEEMHLQESSNASILPVNGSP